MGSNNRSENKPPENPAPESHSATDVILTALKMLLMALVIGSASALMGAMVGGVVTLDLSGVANAAWLLITRALLEGAALGIVAAVIIGAVTAAFDRSSIIPFGAVAGAVVFSGYALYVVFLASWVLSPWGSGIGGVIGCALGIALGSDAAKKRRISPSLQRAVERVTRSPGPHPAEAEWWRADPGDDGDADGD